MKSVTKKVEIPFPKRGAAKGKVIYLPTQKKLATLAMHEAFVKACSDFETALGETDKDYLRALHMRAKFDKPGFDPNRARAYFEKHKRKFRNGSEINPNRIAPVLHLADENEWSELFSVTRSLWSMPYNKGYGRRLRFVVYDEHHEGVMGIIGLQSPPADLSVRDKLFEYPAGQKLELVNCSMDAYAVGAIPPYSYLLGGKLCSGMIATDAVRQAYWRQYAGKKTQMLNNGIQQPLAAVTTTSAFGRSSQYNRLKYKERLLAEPIGYTLGYGTLHLEHLYDQICTYLKMFDDFTYGGFGNGPKVRWQNIARALVRVGLPNTLLRHGVKREVFLYRLVDGLKEGMSGGAFGAPLQLPEKDFANYWRERWAVPRAQRFPEWNQGNEVELIRKTMAQLQPTRN